MEVGKAKAASAVLVLLCLGCETKPDLLPADGVVTVNATPVTGAGVLFAPPMNSGRQPAVGSTDALGRFELSTKGQPGVEPGEYQVSITCLESRGFRPDAGALIVESDPGTPKNVRWVVPQKYAQLETSGLNANVHIGSQSFRFDLKNPAETTPR